MAAEGVLCPGSGLWQSLRLSSIHHNKACCGNRNVAALLATAVVEDVTLLQPLLAVNYFNTFFPGADLRLADDALLINWVWLEASGEVGTARLLRRCDELLTGNLLTHLGGELPVTTPSSMVESIGHALSARLALRVTLVPSLVEPLACQMALACSTFNVHLSCKLMPFLALDRKRRLVELRSALRP